MMQPFHPLIQNWFIETFSAPTAVQQQTWRQISQGAHCLVTAPTGSGKTMAAFLWALNQLLTAQWEPGGIRVLYISPLKALNNDIRRNLLGPLDELERRFSKAGLGQTKIHVAVRSGDTPADERRRMLRYPPEILITTPETLNNLLTSKNGPSLLTGIKTVIMDEIHAVAGGKRGTHLITAVDRLVALAGEFQRVALSATVNPLERIAAFVGGLRMFGTGNEAYYEPRPVSIVNVPSEKRYEIKVDFPTDGDQSDADNSRWLTLVQRFKETIKGNRATLLFANSRRLTEKITRLINEKETELLAYAHHGSLAKELRLAVEQKLKIGDLKAIVATSSLELGIDIGALQEVLLIQTPMSVAAAIQRVGRAGHGVGAVSRGVIYPTFGLDFVAAAAMAKAIPAKAVEEIPPIEAPLDVLTQTVLSMTCQNQWHVDDLFAWTKTSYPYRHLSRKQFDLVIAMLTGHYADLRIKELAPRLSFDRLSGMLKARKGTDFLLYLAGGTIADRGYFDLRLEDSGSKIGELDEEFVWERNLGDSFAMGSRVWRIKKITHNDVVVAPAEGRWDIIPFWKAETQNRDHHFSEMIADFLEQADQRLGDADFYEDLLREYGMTPSAARQLIDFLALQQKQTGVALPHRHHLLMEHVEASAGQTDTKQLIIHTFWGGRLNRPLALALSAAWEKLQNPPLQIFADNDGVALMLPSTSDTAKLFEWVTPQNLEALVIRKLEQSGLFGALFRENAGRAMLLPKQNFKKRMPLWLNRLRAKKLLAAVGRHDDFPILIETYRACLADEFDLANLKHRLAEIQRGEIRIGETFSRSASPFASGLVFRQTNLHMYADDTPLGADHVSLPREYIQELLASSHLRPRFPETLLTAFRRKLQRSLPGYAPESEEELTDWVKERLLIPPAEWEELLTAMEAPFKISAAPARIIKLSWPGSGPFVCALEIVPQVCAALALSLEACTLAPLFSDKKKMPPSRIEDFRQTCLQQLSDRHLFSFEEDEDQESALENFIAQWLSYYGPKPQDELRALFGISTERLTSAISRLTETSTILVDIFSQSQAAPEICTSDNLERLLYLHRQSRRPRLSPLPLADLPLFVARMQGFGSRKEDINALQESLERLFGLPLSAGFWEEAVWPARLETYHPAWLDTLLQTSDLAWFGWGERKLAFAFKQDLELFLEPNQDPKARDIAPLPGRTGKYGLLEVAQHSRLTSVEASRQLWERSWQGAISNDTFEVIRKGVQHKFNPAKVSACDGTASSNKRSFGRRSAFNRWKSSRPLEGHWYALPPIDPLDPLEEAEITRDRARQLFKRYGVLFRQLLAREAPVLQWKRIFKALRLMEFSGEIFSGHFFDGIPGLQFASREALAHLQQPLQTNKIFWMNAQDPASLCGVDLPALKKSLPSRQPATYLVYQDNRLMLTVKRSGRELLFSVPPDHPRLEEILQIFKDLLSREFNPPKKITVKKVNGESVLESPFLEKLQAFGFEKSFDCLELWRTF